MTVVQEVDTALVVRYVVSIDDQSLGSFSTCEGLGCEVVVETREEGGSNDFLWQFPTRVKYPNITLTRPLGPGTAQIAAWVSGVARGYRRHTGTIQAMSAAGAIVAEWGLVGVIPVRWKGPSLSPDAGKVAMESIEIAHHGFATTR